MSGYDLDVTTPRARAAQAAYASDSAALDDDPFAVFDVDYGTHARQRYDVFCAGDRAPAILFFHGGYWRAGSKEARRFPAPVWRTRGVVWVSAGYRLCPEARLAQSVEDARSALAHLAGNAGAFGIDPARIHLCGNSAGAHLAAMAAASDTPVASLTVLSGLFDLTPLIYERAAAHLDLTLAMARELSPLLHLPPPSVPVTIGWGGEESQDFADRPTRSSPAPTAVGRGGKSGLC